jgi:hypothetical protein
MVALLRMAKLSPRQKDESTAPTGCEDTFMATKECKRQDDAPILTLLEVTPPNVGQRPNIRREIVC